MKKIGTLNSDISRVISDMGHMDKLVIADAGLPVPMDTEKIDLALTHGVPGFLQTLETILGELEVEAAIVAEEIQTKSPESLALFEELKKILGDIPVTFVSHEEFKKLLPSSRAVVRTGEMTPYANIILISGVIF
jgi:D-ribose pyranase